jgi:1-acyl-sn-glycerol-3-phosphate acyltransferase
MALESIVHGLEFVAHRLNPKSYLPSNHARNFVDTEPSELMFKTLKFVLGTMGKMAYKIDVEGEENMRPGLLLVKHQSWADVFIGINYVPPLTIMAKDAIYFPVMGNIIAHAGAKPVFRRNRNDPDNARGYQLHGQALMNGETDAMFPEGHRVHGEMGRFMNGLRYVLNAYAEEYHKSHREPEAEPASLHVTIMGISPMKPYWRSFRSPVHVKIGAIQWNEYMHYDDFRDEAYNLMAELSGLPATDHTKDLDSVLIS